MLFISKLLNVSKMNLETLIKNFEGLKLTSYKDIGGVWTIGYGTTYNYKYKRPVQQGDEIDEATALKWLKIEINKKKDNIKKFIKIAINNNQLDSLISLSYNIGETALKNSTLLKLLNAGKDKVIVANEFMKWNKAKVNGKLQVIDGLTKRRELEKKLFLS